MSEKAKLAGSWVLLLSGFGVNFTVVIGLAYSQGQKDARTEEKISSMAERITVAEVVWTKTREKADDKFDVLIKAVSRLEALIEKR